MATVHTRFPRSFWGGALARGSGTSPRLRLLFLENGNLGRPIWRFGRYNCYTKPIIIHFVLGMFGLAICPNLPKFEMQGEKSGDFLSDFLKKYYSNLAWKIALYKI
uniref:hypothetical protein n=1 Tax=Streptomyces goshikiensis TaxID=1942 RepID=UPI0036D898A7